MHRDSHFIAFMLLAICTTLSKAQVSRGPYLSTFRTENLKINAPPRRFSSIIDEAVWLMKTHFLKRELLTRKEWESLPRKFAAYSDVNEAMEELMTSFNDPYSRHIPKTIMMVRQRGIRGEAVGIGIILKRKWHLEEIRSAICRLFLQSTNHIKTSSPSVLSAATTTTKRGGIFTYLRNRFGKKSEIVLEASYGRNSIDQCCSLLQHLKVSLHTAVPFIIAATCQHIDTLKHNSSGLNVRTIRIFFIVLGMINIFRKVSPIICPIEVASIQPEGPSELSGVEIGDQLFFIDGKTIDNFSLKKVNELLCEGEVGDIVNVGILRSQCLPVKGDTNYDTNLSGGTNFGAEGNHLYVDKSISACPAVQWVHKVQSNSTENAFQKNSNRDKKIHLSLEITRDNVLSSKVSSCILSRPSYFQRGAPEEKKERFHYKSGIVNEIMLEGDVVATAKNIKKNTGRDANRDQSGYGSIGYISIGEFTQRTLFEVENAIEDIKYQLHVLSCNNDIKQKKNKDGRVGRFKDKNNISLSSNPDLASNDISTICKDSVTNYGDVRNVKIPNHLDALVIDLRGNLGGTLPSALDAASLFLSKGQVLLQMKRIASTDGDTNRDNPGVQNQKSQSYVTVDENRLKPDNKKRKRIFPLKFSSPLRIFKRHKKDRCEKYYSTFENPDIRTPLLLLVDSQTASASEIFVAALMDNNRATCMGSRTVGKNVAQAIMMLSDGSGLVFTVREFLSPLGRYMGHGIKPNLLLNDPSKIDLRKIYFDNILQKWELMEMTFEDNCNNIFQ